MTVASEQIKMRLEVLRGETFGSLNHNFRIKVQLEEQVKENEVTLHFRRGILEGLEMAKNAIDEIEKGVKLNELRARAQAVQAKGNDHQESQIDALDVTTVRTNTPVGEL